MKQTTYIFSEGESPTLKRCLGMEKLFSSESHHFEHHSPKRVAKCSSSLVKKIAKTQLKTKLYNKQQTFER